MTPPSKRAIITGITGQDGSYLAEFLIGKGYEVHGFVRRSSSFSTGRIEHLYRDPHDPDCRLRLHYADMSDSSALSGLVQKIQPEEIYNLAAQSHVRVSFDQPVFTSDVTGVGALKLLEAVRDYQQSVDAPVRFYQASSSEQFGKVLETPQRESTPFNPCSPYAVAKVFAHSMTAVYRQSYGLHASCGILFNHESPRRGETFVTRKITRAVGRIKLGLQHKLHLGNLDAQRDWGYARDYVEAMWLMLQQPEPDDFVIATGETRSVREFCEAAFGMVDLDYRQFVSFDERYLRPSEVELLLGDPSKAAEQLGWRPRTSFAELVEIMVDHDLELAQREKVLVESGHGGVDLR